MTNVDKIIATISHGSAYKNVLL